ncbi:MAG: hypothetical protein WDW38_001121 [Sanguina aurantia]
MDHSSVTWFSSCAVCVSRDQVPDSFGYGISGKKASNGIFTNYGPTFAPGDEILCFLDTTRVPATVSFSLNAKLIGEAFAIPPNGKPLFPHVLIKNMAATLDFEGRGTVNGFQPWAGA